MDKTASSHRAFLRHIAQCRDDSNIYTITAYCAIAMAAEACGFEGSLYDFSNMVSVSLTERIWMAELTNRYNILKERKKKELLLWPDLFPGR